MSDQQTLYVCDPAGDPLVEIHPDGAIVPVREGAELEAVRVLARVLNDENQRFDALAVKTVSDLKRLAQEEIDGINKIERQRLSPFGARIADGSELGQRRKLARRILAEMTELEEERPQ